MSVVVETAGLRKAFGLGRRRRLAIDGLDLAVPGGGVHGFLGPNGSGKTTTLRLLLGLVLPDEGRARILGQAVPSGLPAVMARVGAVVEQPQFFPAFSGRLNLRLLADAGGVHPQRVDAVLEVVGLLDRADDRYRAYSLGMKQRLAIAAALLKEPELLILDEPANGLDPAGIRDVRRLVRRVADGGATVLVSSHLLAEVQQVCDSVTIIAKGRHVATGAVRDVLARAAPARLRVGVADLGAGERVLREAGFDVGSEGGQLVVRGADDPASVSRALGARDLWVTSLVAESVDLESVFLELTGPEADPSRPVEELP